MFFGGGVGALLGLIAFWDSCNRRKVSLCIDVSTIGIACSPPAMFALPGSMSRVSSAPFAQARLGPGSASAQVSSPISPDIVNF